ncbi:plasmid mobilization protein [Hymenobacter defluvii]|uniref:Plasmid mobilization relaxosome protein MobC n=1 Tax=Hymenobacter defluvii TaxID=2054411 RepID=A0ABS3THJ2_9BACT|nr:plasmid mobilization relaxosome protein MobC [Hymenobacter defluvii]MBO3273124.1 plasmid mobilization relaxosome protein MobC [Hymenobacter defluvii]
MNPTPDTEGKKERTKEVLDARFEFRLSKAEKQLIAEKAKLAGLKPNEFVRRAALGIEVKERMPADLRRFVGGVANNLNQLTRLANSGKLNAASGADLGFIAKALMKFIQS